MKDEITIGVLAKAAGVNVETIRYYQRRQLVDEPSKPLGGHRRYAAEAIKRVRFIKRAQQLGFTLEEIKGLLRLEDGQKLAVIEARIADLRRMGRLLRGLAAQCRQGGRPRSCPIISSLSGGD